MMIMMNKEMTNKAVETKTIEEKKGNDTMMKSEKMTNKKALEFVLTTFKNELPKDVTEKLNNMIAQLDKKNGKSKKPTANQKENAVIKQSILDSMEVGKQYTISELMKEVEALKDLSNQKVSALVKQLKDENKLEREEIKRKAYFSLKIEETEEEVED